MISAGIELEDFLFLYVNNWYGIGIWNRKDYICRDMIQIERHIKSIAALCRKYKVNYFDLKYSLQDLFGREVDLVEEQTIRNPYFRKSVDSTKQLIYG